MRITANSLISDLISFAIPMNKKKRLRQQLKNNWEETIEVLIKLIEMKDPYTKGHSEEVAKWSGIIAQNLNLNKDEQEEIKLAARLHDIGKIGISEEILNKPGRLSKEEYVEIKKHPVLGADLFLNIKQLENINQIIRYHHEWYNGEGYPDGLIGEKIPLGSRIINIADSYQAMTSDRPYRKALSKREAMAEFKSCAGSQFDPEIAMVFIKILNGFIPEQIGLNRKRAENVVCVEQYI